MKLVGRRAEGGMKARLVEAMCAVQSQALVLCGDVGVGKTALLEYLVRPFDPDCAIETAGQGPDHVFPAPELFTAATTLGHYHGVTDRMQMSKMAGYYDPILIALGFCYPEWR